MEEGTYPPILCLSTCHQNHLGEAATGVRENRAKGRLEIVPPLSPKSDLDPKLPDQAPEVYQGMRQGSLCGDVGLASVCALRKTH